MLRASVIMVTMLKIMITFPAFHRECHQILKQIFLKKVMLQMIDLGLNKLTLILVRINTDFFLLSHENIFFTIVSLCMVL